MFDLKNPNIEDNNTIIKNKVVISLFLIVK